MEFHNQIKDEFITLESVKTFLILLYPFAPHMAEELNQIISSSAGQRVSKASKSLQLEKWPEFDPSLIMDQTVEIIVQINGKVKAKLTVNSGSTQEVVQAEVMKLPVVMEAMKGETIKRAVFVPNRLMNLVI